MTTRLLFVALVVVAWAGGLAGRAEAAPDAKPPTNGSALRLPGHRQQQREAPAARS
jgi:hypothetical protein